MKSTDVLMSEHRVIEQVLDVLEAITRQAERAATFDTASAGEAIDFFRTFADRCHHGKEEGHLFPMLEARGMLRDGGPTGVMLREHELGRDLLQQLAAAVERASAAEFVEPARAYLMLLRDHIWKEDHRLFRLAGQLLDAADDRELVRAFDRTEHDDMGTAAHEDYLALADRLADRFGMARADVPRTCGGCGHCKAGNAAAVSAT